MKLVVEVYTATAAWPSVERFGLIDQIRRAAVSIPSNVAEGHARAHRTEFRQHLAHARGSLAEMVSQLMIAEQLGSMILKAYTHIEEKAAEVGHLLHGLISSLPKPPSSNP